jgi:ribosome-associated protein
MKDAKKDPRADADTGVDSAAEPTPAAEPVMPDDSNGFKLAELVVWRLLEKQAQAVVILDLRGRSDVCDFFVLASGHSDVHVRSLAKNLHNAMIDVGQKAKGLEGMNEGRWALLDFFDVVVHIFDDRVREYFQLEKLWGDAPRLDLEPAWFAADEVAARHPDVKFHLPGPPAAGDPDQGT